jgi:two-component system cell cycle response regulator
VDGILAPHLAQKVRTMRILLIDDDTKLTDLLQLVFESKGFGVTIANSGIQALESLETELPEAVLLDLMMPGMSGLEVCQRIRANPRTSAVPVVVLTAKSGIESKQELLKAGATDYLVKPVPLNDLVSRIGALVTDTGPPAATVLT